MGLCLTVIFQSYQYFNFTLKYLIRLLFFRQKYIFACRKNFRMRTKNLKSILIINVTSSYIKWETSIWIMYFGLYL